MAKHSFVIDVICILMLLCIFNFAYMHCLRNIRSKKTGGKKKLSLDAQNSSSFSDTTYWASPFLNYFGVTYENPWEEYMKRFDNANNSNMKPIKGAQFGIWSEDDDECTVLEYKTIQDFPLDNVQNVTECGEKLKEQKKKNSNYNWAYWNVKSKKCEIYNSKPDCLLPSSDGYSFVSIEKVDSEIYDLPECNDDSKTWKITAKCNTTNTEVEFQCMANEWYSLDCKTSLPKHVIPVPKVEEEEEEEEKATNGRNIIKEREKKESEVENEEEDEAARKEGEEETTEREGETETTEREGETETTEREGETETTEREKIEEKDAAERKDTQKRKEEEVAQFVTEKVNEAMNKLDEKEQQLEHQLEDKINDDEKNAVAHLLNKANNIEKNLIENITNMSKNGNGNKYALSFGVVNVAFMFVIATLVF